VVAASRRDQVDQAFRVAHALCRGRRAVDDGACLSRLLTTTRELFARKPNVARFETVVPGTRRRTVGLAMYRALVDANGDFKQACQLVSHADLEVRRFFNGAADHVNGTAASWLDIRHLINDPRSHAIARATALQVRAHDAKQCGAQYADWLIANRDAVVGNWIRVVHKAFRDAVISDAQIAQLDGMARLVMIEQAMKSPDTTRFIQHNAWSDFAQASGEAVAALSA
jgi:hypothetical protein